MNGWDRVGAADLLILDSGQLWIRRFPNGWRLLHRFTDPTGVRRWSTLATHRTRTAALADAEALVGGSSLEAR